MSFERFPCDDGFQGRDCVVFFPGWGFKGDILALHGPPPLDVYFALKSVVDLKIHHCIEFIEGLKKKNIRVILMGWSMGGVYLYKNLSYFKELVNKIVFCSLRRDYPSGLIESMCNMLKRDKGLCLRYFYRECFKGHASSYRLFKETLEEEFIESFTTNELVRGLQFLKENPIDQIISPGSCVDALVVQGRDDAVAPVRLMPRVGRNVGVFILEGCGHLPFLKQEFFREIIGVEVCS